MPDQYQHPDTTARMNMLSRQTKVWEQLDDSNEPKATSGHHPLTEKQPDGAPVGESVART